MPSLTGLRFAWLACAAAALSSCSAEHERPRSALLVVIDTLRADRLGVYGHVRPTSPKLDRWAADAAVFERVWATSPWTLPSFGSLFTGEAPSRHGAGARLVRGSERGIARMRSGLPTIAEIAREAGLSTGGIIANPFLRAEMSRGFDDWLYVEAPGGGDARAAVLVDRALDWLDEVPRPFLLMVSFFDPHVPYDAQGEARGRFTQGLRSRLRTPVLGVGRANAHWLPPAADRDFVRAAYDEEILYVDAQLDRLLRGLGDRGLAGETLVVIVSDHGEELFEHGAFEHGHSMYDEVLRVPLLVAGPGVVPQRVSTPASIVDVMPTVLEALGLETPDGLAGRSLWPTLAGDDSADGERGLIAESPLYGDDQQAWIRWPFKLVKARGEPVRLFDLSVDAAESADLAQEQPGLAEELRRELRRAIRAGRVPGEPLELLDMDGDTRERLQALGYLEDD